MSEFTTADAFGQYDEITCKAHSVVLVEGDDVIPEGILVGTVSYGNGAAIALTVMAEDGVTGVIAMLHPQAAAALLQSIAENMTGLAAMYAADASKGH